MEKVEFTTEDGKKISANYLDAGGARFAMLLHMMPAVKESWNDFARLLSERGISSLSFDQRGHGESTGGPNGYKLFEDVDQQEKILDVTAAWAELEERGAQKSNTVIVGASIGANLAIQELADKVDLKVAVALSPGLDYRGVTTDDKVSKINDDQFLMLVASDDDQHFSMEAIEKLREINPKIKLVKKSGLGHGTAMFEKDEELMKFVVNWIDEKL